MNIKIKSLKKFHLKDECNTMAILLHLHWCSIQKIN